MRCFVQQMECHPGHVSDMVEMWSTCPYCLLRHGAKDVALVSCTCSRVSLHMFSVLLWSESGALVQPSGGNEERGNTLGSCSLAISPKSLGSLAASRTTERIFSRSQPVPPPSPTDAVVRRGCYDKFKALEFLANAAVAQRVSSI